MDFSTKDVIYLLYSKAQTVIKLIRKWKRVTPAISFTNPSQALSAAIYLLYSKAQIVIKLIRKWKRVTPATFSRFTISFTNPSQSLSAVIYLLYSKVHTQGSMLTPNKNNKAITRSLSQEFSEMINLDYLLTEKSKLNSSK